MRFVETALAGCFVIEPERVTDERGFFVRTFDARLFAARGLNPDLAQASLSFNRLRGTLRGLHFQAQPAPEDKLVRVQAGAIFDVAVDIRLGSPTFGRWIAEELSAENGRQLYIPKGFAHGFQTLADDTTVFYHIAEFFEPSLSAGVAWNDPELGIDWPAQPTSQSQRDLEFPGLSEVDRGLLVQFGPIGAR